MFLHWDWRAARNRRFGPIRREKARILAPRPEFSKLIGRIFIERKEDKWLPKMLQKSQKVTY